MFHLYSFPFANEKCHYGKFELLSTMGSKEPPVPITQLPQRQLLASKLLWFDLSHLLQASRIESC